MDKEIMDGETLIIKYITPGGRGCMKLYLPECYKRPTISWTRKVLKVIDLSQDADKIRTALWEWLNAEFHDGTHPDPESEDYRKAMANRYAEARQIAADTAPEIKNLEKKIEQLQHLVKGKSKKAPERAELKKTKEQLKAAKDKRKRAEKTAKEIPAIMKSMQKEYDAWVTLIDLVGGE